MLSNVPTPDSPPPSGNRFHRAYSTVSRRTRAGYISFVRTSKDPILPLLVLGAIAAAFFAAFVLDASTEIVFGILFIGALTAFMETKMHNDHRDP